MFTLPGCPRDSIRLASGPDADAHCALTMDAASAARTGTTLLELVAQERAGVGFNAQALEQPLARRSYLLSLCSVLRLSAQPATTLEKTHLMDFWWCVSGAGVQPLEYIQVCLKIYGKCTLMVTVDMILSLSHLLNLES